MKIFKKDGQPQPTKIQKRVSGISTTDLVVWAENALFAIGKELTHHQRNQNLDALYEAKLGAEALLAITEELIRRADK